MFSEAITGVEKARHGRVSSPTQRLLKIAQRNAALYVEHTRPRAVLLVGSVAEGLSDEYSDIDMIVYHDEMPSDEQRERVRTQLAADLKQRSEYGETLVVEDVECQVGHFKVAEYERGLSTVLDDLEVDTRVHKWLMGVMSGRALYGESLIERWQARGTAFPDGLRLAMAQHYAGRLFPFWYSEDYWPRRDATLWLHQTLVETSFNILGILAGLNRMYFHPFQFKRSQRFAGRMQVAPDSLSPRLDHLLTVSHATAVREAEQLVLETLKLARDQLPELDLTGLKHWPGERVRPWMVQQDRP